MIGSLWITGVCGFTGRHLVEYLVSLPDRPRIVGLDLGNEPPVQVESYHRIDLCDSEAVGRAGRVDPPAWVIHLAGAMPPAAASQMWRANVGGTCGLLAGLARMGCTGRRIVGIGSAAEYASPPSEQPLLESSLAGGASPYGQSKWAQSLLTLEAGRECSFQTMVARPFNLIGPGLPSRLVAGWVCEQFAKPDCEEIVLGNTHSARDFLDVRDAVRAYWALALHGRPGEIYNVCSGIGVTIEDLLKRLCEIAGRSPPIRIDESRIRSGDPPCVIGSFAKLHEAVGWTPEMPLTRSLADMLRESQQACM